MTTTGPRAAVLAAEFNDPLITYMIGAAEDELRRRGAAHVATTKVPGSYEIPLVADRLLAAPDVDLLVVLGYIEKGETLHGEVMGHVVHAALVRTQLERGKPMGLGIIGPGATPEQAEARKDAYARAAVRAALRAYEVLQGLK